MAKTTKASSKADTAMDYDGLLRANAKRVFSEPSVEQRLTALKELWAEDGVLVENEQVVTGWEAVSGSVGALLQMLPPGTTFEADGLAQFTRDTSFKTVLGDVKFGAGGGWSEPRVLQVQYQNIRTTDLADFKGASTQAVVWPPSLASGALIYPHAKAKRNL
jgi:branched-chain amino acid transport system substrate-binding protein